MEQVSEEHRLSAAGNSVLAERTTQPWLLPEKGINNFGSAIVQVSAISPVYIA